MIFAAGFGTRMGALTDDVPKPMLQFNGRPLIDYCIDLLRDAGVTNIVANTHYLPDTLERHLHDLGVITNREEVILETGGGLKEALPLLGSGPVITMNPDVLWDGPNPVRSILNAWRPDMTALLMVHRTRRETSDFSLYNEEMRRGGPFRYTGLQMIRPERLLDIEDRVFSLNLFWDQVLSQNSLSGLVYEGEWRDVGTEDDLTAANAHAKP